MKSFSFIEMFSGGSQVVEENGLTSAKAVGASENQQSVSQKVVNKAVLTSDQTSQRSQKLSSHNGDSGAQKRDFAASPKPNSLSLLANKGQVNKK